MNSRAMLRPGTQIVASVPALVSAPDKKEDAYRLKDAYAVDSAGIQEAFVYLGEEFYELGMPAVLEHVEGSLARTLEDPGENLGKLEKYLRVLANELVGEEARLRVGGETTLDAIQLQKAKSVLDQVWRVFKASVS